MRVCGQKSFFLLMYIAHLSILIGYSARATTAMANTINCVFTLRLAVYAFVQLLLQHAICENTLKRCLPSSKKI